MIKFLFLILFFTYSFLSSTPAVGQLSKNPNDFLRSNPVNLLNGDEYTTLYSTPFDTLLIKTDTSMRFVRICSAGDVNGDGFSDIMVGGNINYYPDDHWRILIYYGGAEMDNNADLIINGVPGTGIVSLSSAGDVNGDGFSDVVLISNSSNNGLYVNLYLGGQPMDTIRDFAVNTVWEHGANLFVSSAGDINGDGYDDIVRGFGTSWEYWFWYIFYPSYADVYFGGIYMDNIPDVHFNGRDANSTHSSSSFSPTSDLNGDGFTDVIFDNVIHYGGTGNTGINNLAIYSDLNYTSSPAGDMNKDGFSDVIVGAPSSNAANIYYGGYAMNNVADVYLAGEESGNRFGASVTYAGDVNEDGYSDVIVGASGFNNNTGRAYIYYGGSDMDNVPDIIWTGAAENSNFGSSVGFAGDVNGDGSTDVFVIASGRDAYIFMRRPSLNINIKVLTEGMYSSLFNQLSRRDSVTFLLRDVTSPFTIRDSAKVIIDSVTFSNVFPFFNVSPGTYYIVAKHFNSIETWSKTGGEDLLNSDSLYSYNFTTSNTQAYGDNLKLKGNKYCMFSGDVNQDGYINLSDLIPINNDASVFISGDYIVTDLTGDNVVDLTDVTLCFNNASNFVSIVMP